MSCPFRSLRHIFGKENEGVHSVRLFDIAIIDLVMTLIGAYYFAKYFKLNHIYVSIIFILTGHIMHLLFCVKTTFIKKIDSLIYYLTLSNVSESFIIDSI